MKTHTKNGEWSTDEARDVYVSSLCMFASLKLQHVYLKIWNFLILHAPNLFDMLHLGKSLHRSYKCRKREG